MSVLPPSPSPPWSALSWNCNFLSNLKLTQLSMLTSPPTSGPPPPSSVSVASAEPRWVSGVVSVPDGPLDQLTTKGPPDFIALTETKRLSLAVSSTSDKQLSLPGYQLEWQPANRTGVQSPGYEVSLVASCCTFDQFCPSYVFHPFAMHIASS